ncbi:MULTISPECIES: nitroreductase family deazaflavin-dependent oxidoreductase [Gordonia]|uniref:Nitroreductase family deazaflavin-dependent oxidoreductase n=1 Tax=Gordonia amicalis TaxID=89053 RepID=A0AAE4U5S3_9ACTN|nr:MULTISPECIES: nitroreductase family deazaflavin-dependent oxidoreductase [Gordonia]ATD72138.1 nitroreductase family deazaflavin-dependent oxidoreductase [Gordonia sp. 1D]KAF0969312.1 Deazaflavin-dependent nitroreductase [Gordonia sp. YY1]MBA5848171.1 nitroreductase family deazaflavin-dependent oxidoreductase [Gordonia amicalis]MCZ0914686.1 nitroreductase family deazaflavin-dependent oxidoreductase [Gordonia amicalis]MCZ4579874.1 nitroreductase family deazaflavin-dependent oxidoreductase [Go
MAVFDPDKKPDQLDSPIVSTIIKLGSRAHTAVYKLTGGRFGETWRIGAGLKKPAPVCLLTTIGRKSGQPRTAPLIYLRRGDAFVVVASQGGSAKHPAWYLNLRDNPQVTIQLGKEKYDLVAHTATDAERAGLWPDLVKVYADYDTYAAWTDREIPVVICKPAAAA